MMRRFGLAFNDWFEKWMFLIIPCSLVAGFLSAPVLQRFVDWIPFLFAYVTLTMAIGCGLGQLREVMKKPGIMGLTFLIAHIVSPFIAYWMGVLLFGTDSPYVIGLVLFTIIPLGVSTVLWVGMSGGSVPLILAMVVLDSMLSPLVVPAGIAFLFDTAVEVEAGPLMLDLTILIVLPTIVGIALYELTGGKIQAKVKPYTAPVSKLCFAAVVTLNASAIAPYMHELKGDMLTLVPLVIALVGICYALGYLPARMLRVDREQLVTVSFAAGMRNISLGTVLALGYFSPLAAVPVVLSILIQQPLATLHHYVLQKLHNRNTSQRMSRNVR
ncbi:bile acid:sodium symporter family protein [Paenibacillus sp. J5C2022]|uniref:bile acid:sodium symporter family protein n=1 Tax=Paenibacillus sp. J5C2022 TaxID=2977129 RepID=UPI0021CEC79C|nr:bile acid:sodium symporter family protein [Paenibacillus sp. J5C2022]